MFLLYCPFVKLENRGMVLYIYFEHIEIVQQQQRKERHKN